MERGELSTDRRTLLGGVVATVSGTVGCLGSASEDDRRDTVSLFAAGSLHNGLEHGLKPAVDPRLQIEARGSAAVVRLVADDQKDPDIVSIADVALLESILDPDWIAEFATNSIVLAYNPKSEGGRRLAAAGDNDWYRPLVNGDVTLGRTDPDLDPLGYRTLFALELATDHYKTATDLRAEIPRRDQVYPETQLVSQFETGAIDAAFTYRSMAVDRQYEFVSLPAAINLGDPAFTDRYSTAAYELPGGTVVSGDLISYGTTIRHRSPAVDRVFDTHTNGEYLTEFGFTVPGDYPQYTGNVPDSVAN